MNDIVKYDNYMNNLRFSGFTTFDYNFLMALCNKLMDKDTTEITISFEELREKTGYTQHPVKQFVSDIVRMNDKLMKMNCVLEKDGTIFQFVLFPTFATDMVNRRLIVSVNEKFKFILNDLTRNFTRFELNEFVRLGSRYSKSLYRILKQFKSTGRYDVSMDSFRNRMDCPVSYTNKHVMDKIIKPSLKELREKNYFQNLRCETKYANKPGRPVLGYTFTFLPEKACDTDNPDAETQVENAGNRQPADWYKSFHQRTYDYDSLEKELLGKPDPDEPEAGIFELLQELKRMHKST